MSKQSPAKPAAAQGTVLANGNPLATPLLTPVERREELLALLALQRVEGLGSHNLNLLLNHFGSARSLLDSESTSAQADYLRGLGPRARANLASFLSSPASGEQRQLARQSLAWVERHGAQLLLHNEPEFPALLREINDCPPLLFVLGQASSLRLPGIAIVGTRRPTSLGRRLARTLAGELGRAGYCIYSGLALGIDAEVHRGALQMGAKTVAVMATGIDSIYPGSHRALGEQIVASGALLTEMPLATPAVPGLFPRRNRLVSGMCKAVIVVEAGLPSGSLHTANFAAEQGREVFAVPGAANNAMARGCHQLLRDGAHLVEGPGDVLDVLGQLFTGPAAETAPLANKPHGPAALTPPQRLVLDALKAEAEPAVCELLSLRTGLATDVLACALVELELEGMILADAGRFSPAP